MKRENSPHKPAAHPDPKPARNTDDQGTPWAFYLLMAVLLAALIYFIILPFFL